MTPKISPRKKTIWNRSVKAYYFAIIFQSVMNIINVFNILDISSLDQVIKFRLNQLYLLKLMFYVCRSMIRTLCCELEKIVIYQQTYNCNLFTSWKL